MDADSSTRAPTAQAAAGPASPFACASKDVCAGSDRTHRRWGRRVCTRLCLLAGLGATSALFQARQYVLQCARRCFWGNSAATVQPPPPGRLRRRCTGWRTHTCTRACTRASPAWTWSPKCAAGPGSAAGAQHRLPALRPRSARRCARPARPGRTRSRPSCAPCAPCCRPTRPASWPRAASRWTTRRCGAGCARGAARRRRPPR